MDVFLGLVTFALLLLTLVCLGIWIFIEERQHKPFWRGMTFWSFVLFCIFFWML